MVTSTSFGGQHDVWSILLLLLYCTTICSVVALFYGRVSIQYLYGVVYGADHHQMEIVLMMLSVGLWLCFTRLALYVCND